MPTIQKPSKGRIVHYTALDGEVYNALVHRVRAPNEPSNNSPALRELGVVVDLMVFYPSAPNAFGVPNGAQMPDAGGVAVAPRCIPDIPYCVSPTMRGSWRYPEPERATVEVP